MGVKRQGCLYSQIAVWRESHICIDRTIKTSSRSYLWLRKKIGLFIDFSGEQKEKDFQLGTYLNCHTENEEIRRNDH